MPRIFGGFLLLLVIAAGCGPPGRPRVEGKVTLNGKALGNQTLTLFFEGQGGNSFDQRIAIRPDGTFSGEVPSPGTYKVRIEPSLAAQEKGEDDIPGQVSVPPKYRDRATSGLEWDIRPGFNQREFNLD